MNKVSRNIVATFVLLAMMAAGGNFAKAQKTAKPSGQPVAMASGTSSTTPNVAQLQATADRATAKIQASATEKQALVKAVQSKNTDMATAVLLRNGFTAQQLQGAKIILTDNTGGGSGGGVESKIKVTVVVKCCPPSITITVSW